MSRDRGHAEVVYQRILSLMCPGIEALNDWAAMHANQA